MNKSTTALLALAFLGLLAAGSLSAAEKPRARDLGLPFDGTPGRWNAITDVPGVAVGFTTLISGEPPLKEGGGPIRTGVTGYCRGARAPIEIRCSPAGFASTATVK